MLRPHAPQQPLQVAPRTGRVAARIGLVDCGVALLDVHDEIAHHLGGTHHALALHLQRRLRRQVPPPAADGLELLQEIHPQQRLPAAEADTAARGDEVEVVHPHAVVELLRSVAHQPLGRLQAATVEAVAATQRTPMERRQRGHPHPVDTQAVTVDAYERYCFHLRITFI